MITSHKIKKEKKMASVVDEELVSQKIDSEDSSFINYSSRQRIKNQKGLFLNKFPTFTDDFIGDDINSPRKEWLKEFPVNP